MYTVHNAGPSHNVGGFSISDTLPDGFAFQLSGSSTECEASGQDITCTDNSGFPVGTEDRSFTVHAKISSSVAENSYSDFATLTSLGTSDPGGSDNTDGDAVAVIARANLALVAGTPTYPGTQTAAWANATSTQNFVIYEYTVTNGGPSDALNVSFTNATHPSELTFVGACAGGTGCSPTGTLPVSIGTLEGSDGTLATQSTHVRVKFTANATARGGPLTKTILPSGHHDHDRPDSDKQQCIRGRHRLDSSTTPTAPDARPGNANAYFLWEHTGPFTAPTTPTQPWGVDFFAVTVTGASAPSVSNVFATDQCGTSGTKQVFCTNVAPLLNPNPTPHPYTFVVRAS